MVHPPRRYYTRRKIDETGAMIDAFHGERASRVVSKAQSSRTVHRPEDSMFLEQMANDRLLVSIDPAGEQQQEEGERGRHRGHGGSLPDRRPPFNRCETWAFSTVRRG